MYQDARQQYLQNDILSASPQKMRKLLIDGAIRFSRNAIECWKIDDFENGLVAINRARDIITELLATIRQDVDNSEIRKVYFFLNREITIASFERSAERMQGVIKILEVEQETWGLVCQQLANPELAPNAPINPATASPHYSPAPGSAASLSPGSFSFEA